MSTLVTRSARTAIAACQRNSVFPVILLLEFVATALPEMSALVVALGRPETARLDELERHATRIVRI